MFIQTLVSIQIVIRIFYFIQILIFLQILILKDLDKEQTVLMTHGDSIDRVADNFKVINIVKK